MVFQPNKVICMQQKSTPEQDSLSIGQMEFSTFIPKTPVIQPKPRYAQPKQFSFQNGEFQDKSCDFTSIPTQSNS